MTGTDKNEFIHKTQKDTGQAIFFSHFNKLLDKDKNGDSLEFTINLINRFQYHSLLDKYIGYDNFKAVKNIIENNKNIINDKIDSNGYTALILASAYGYFEIIKYLIEQGADINVQNDYGNTALDLAKKQEIKEYLIQHGAKTGKELKNNENYNILKFDQFKNHQI